MRIALLSGAVMIALQFFVVKLAFLVVPASEHVQRLATQYFYIRIWAAPATLSLFSLMTSSPEVIAAGREYIPWLLVMPLIGCPAFVWDGVFIGATASPQLRNSTLLCAIGFFAVWFAGRAMFPSVSLVLHILMAAYFTHLAVRSLYLTFSYKKSLKHIP